jgi:predicted HTH domain antitoxin
MASMQLELDEDLVKALRLLDQPVDEAARELIVLELYRRAVISSGKAAQLLGMDRFEFIRHASRLGIPYFQMTPEELDAELEHLKSLSD